MISFQIDLAYPLAKSVAQELEHGFSLRKI